jgi:hypothetical protein
VLVAENHGRCVTERDRSGKVVWQRGLHGYAASCQRLPNGNTFVVSENQVLEISRDGRDVLTLSFQNILYAGRRLRNGQIVLLTNAGTLLVLDSVGKELRSVDVGGVVSWSSFEFLSDGKFLACAGDGKVVELDGLGKRLWEAAVPNATSCHRLPNGNTLVSDSEGRRIVELGRDGKIVSELRLKGRPWHVATR